MGQKDQTCPRPNTRQVLHWVETSTEDEINDAHRQGTFDNKLEVIGYVVACKRTGNQDMSELLRILNADMWAILSVKAEGDAEVKFESRTQGERL